MFKRTSVILSCNFYLVQDKANLFFIESKHFSKNFLLPRYLLKRCEQIFKNAEKFHRHRIGITIYHLTVFTIYHLTVLSRSAWIYNNEFIIVI